MLYLSLGMTLNKVHCVLRFQQTPWLKIYIDFNIEKRKKRLFNSNSTTVPQKPGRKLKCKPPFNAFRIFDDNLAAVHILKQRLYLNRPFYVGFAILDLSKILCTTSIITTWNNDMERKRHSSLRTQTSFATPSRTLTCTRTCWRTVTCLTPQIISSAIGSITPRRNGIGGKWKTNWKVFLYKS